MLSRNCKSSLNLLKFGKSVCYQVSWQKSTKEDNQPINSEQQRWLYSPLSEHRVGFGQEEKILNSRRSRMAKTGTI